MYWSPNRHLVLHPSVHPLHQAEAGLDGGAGPLSGQVHWPGHRVRRAGHQQIKQVVQRPEHYLLDRPVRPRQRLEVVSGGWRLLRRAGQGRGLQAVAGRSAGQLGGGGALRVHDGGRTLEGRRLREREGTTRLFQWWILPPVGVLVSFVFYRLHIKS